MGGEKRMSNEEEMSGIPLIEQKESIKLSKGARGIYSWEIKLKEDVITNSTISRLEDLNDILKLKFKEE